MTEEEEGPSMVQEIFGHVCPPQYSRSFCLNGGDCFEAGSVGSHVFGCRCFRGYTGHRCQFKKVESYNPTLEQNGWSQSAVIVSCVSAVVFAVVILLVACSLLRRKRNEVIPNDIGSSTIIYQTEVLPSKCCDEDPLKSSLSENNSQLTASILFYKQFSTSSPKVHIKLSHCLPGSSNSNLVEGALQNPP